MKNSFLLLAFLFPLFQNVHSQSSVLSSGNWVKISTEKEGIYKISYTDLQSYGINPNSIDPRNIQLFGNGGGMLPQANNSPKVNDLKEVAIQVIGESDGVFDPSDYLLFYGQATDKWVYKNQNFSHQKNIYDDFTYYFLTIGSTNGKRISLQNSSISAANYISNQYDNLIFHELDSINLIQSGREWFGEKFDTQLSYNFNYTITNLAVNSTAVLNYAVAARSPVSSQIDVTCNGNTSSSLVYPVNMNSLSSEYAALGSSTLNFTPLSNTISINFTYNKPDTASKAWLNYFELITRNFLSKNNNQMLFFDTSSIGVGNITKFEISNTVVNDIVWEITNHNDVVEQSTTFSAGKTEFILNTDSLRKFVVFDVSNLLNPSYIANVANQDLQGIGNPEMIIVTHPNFIAPATNLANFHVSLSGMNSKVVTTEEIYNEFSSGAQDITAINDFMEYLYNQTGSNLKYLLLLGDASYDYKNRILPNTNFVPTYQSDNSTHFISSYASDDYFGLLDINEGEWATNETIDVAIGRLPVSSIQQANDMVNKIIYYKTNVISFDNWRKTITFIADDEDGNLHMAQADNFTETVNDNACDFNVEKIYLDEYQQVINGQQQTYPAIEEKIINIYRRGSSIINFSGHGGNGQLTYENVLDTNALDTLNNSNYPLFISVGTNLGRFDNPKIKSFVEQFLLASNSGNIACISPSRLVFSGPIFVFNTKIYDNNIFIKTNGSYKTMGEFFMQTKNYNPTSNTRNITFLGDPALTLNFPKYVVNAIHLDTLQSTSTNTISGQIEDDTGVLQNGFNGNLIVFIQGSKDTIVTLANDGGSPYVFYDRRDTVYYDTVPIINGVFNFNINLTNAQTHIKGDAKISYYAFSNSTDASGCNDNIYVNDVMTSIFETNLTELSPTIYPNPASDYVNITLKSTDEYTFDLYNNYGQLVVQKTFFNNNITFQVNDLKNGIYFYRLHKANGQNSSGKLQITH